jgi:glutathione S-transferase
MKLYYSPGACSLGIHVILEEIGKPFDTQLVSLKEGAQMKPEFQAINPKGKVPVLQLGDGTVITEWIAIAGWLASTNPEAKLVPEDKMEWTRGAEAMSYITGTMHGMGFTRIFRPEKFTPNPDDKEKIRAEGKKIFSEGFGVMEKTLDGKEWVLDHYSIADAALFYVSRWAEASKGAELPPHVAEHYQRMKARPAVQRAMQAEGLG